MKHTREDARDLHWVAELKSGQQDDVKALGALLYEMVYLEQYS